MTSVTGNNECPTNYTPYRESSGQTRSCSRVSDSCPAGFFCMYTAANNRYYCCGTTAISTYRISTMTCVRNNLTVNCFVTLLLLQVTTNAQPIILPTEKAVAKPDPAPQAPTAAQLDSLACILLQTIDTTAVEQPEVSTYRISSMAFVRNNLTVTCCVTWFLLQVTTNVQTIILPTERAAAKPDPAPQTPPTAVQMDSLACTLLQTIDITAAETLQVCRYLKIFGLINQISLLAL